MTGGQVLYNVALLRTYGSPTYASAIWDSATFGTGSAPFTLTLGPVSRAAIPACCYAPRVPAAPAAEHGRVPAAGLHPEAALQRR